MPLVNSFSEPALSTDPDGDVVMAHALSSPPISPFKEKFSFDWFKFDGNSSSLKSPIFSPVSPATPSQKLSVSTASPTSYFHGSSPITPATPEKSTVKAAYLTASRPSTSQFVLPTPPTKPLNWVWQCHQCRSRYQLSVTRRCLIDGHYYCSGDTSQNQRNNKRRRKAQSCTSEFDYVGWQDWGQWYRECAALRAYANGKAAPKLHGCEGCSFPSQCRYESRPPIETVEFEKYVKGKDIVAMEKKEVQTTSPKKAAFAEELGKVENGKENLLVTRATRKKGQKLAKVESSGEKMQQKSPTEKRSKRHRFYSSLAGNTSSADLSPTREACNPFDKGKFDPSLPSISNTPDKSTTTTIPIDPVLTSQSHSHPGSTHTDLQAIEATLKAALADQRPKSTDSATTSTSPSQSPSTLTTVPILKRSVNSKLGNHEFETTPSGLINSNITTASTSSVWEIKPPPGLTLPRSDSQQSLRTDFFRQGKNHKSRDKDKDTVKPYAKRTRRAASEADIASFLRLNMDQGSSSSQRSTLLAVRPEGQRASSYDAATNAGAGDFEDISLSPVTRSPSTVVLQTSPPPGLGLGLGLAARDMDVAAEPVKKPPLATSVEAAIGSDKSAGAFGLLNFGFGRK